MFWDRTQELDFLEREYRKPGGSLLVVYGRRRVGKTTLLKEFMADKPAIYFLADPQLETEQGRRFQEALASFLADPLIREVDFTGAGTRFSPTWSNAPLSSARSSSCSTSSSTWRARTTRFLRSCSAYGTSAGATAMSFCCCAARC